MNYRKNGLKIGEKRKNKYTSKRKFKKAKIITYDKIASFKHFSHKKFILKIKNYKQNTLKLNNWKGKFQVFFEGIGLLLFIISYYFYYLSLDKCLEGEDECTRKLNWIQLRLYSNIYLLL
jgi:hypothetical protein